MAFRSGSFHALLALGATVLLVGVSTACTGAVDPTSSRALTASWIAQASGVTASLRGVSAVDDRTAWASGSNGIVLRTLDGGAAWSVIPVPGAEKTDFRDIEAFGPDEAVVMGIDRPARIFRTADGGRTWIKAYENDSPGIFLDGMSFFDGKHGLAVGDPMDGRFFVLVTADGGASWRPLPFESRPAARDGEAAFAASGTSAAVLGRDRAWLATGGSAARVWRSEDRGLHWAAVPSGLIEGRSSAGGFSVAFLDRRSGIAVGGDYRAEAAAEGNAAVSSDGGRTWVPVTSARPGGFREAVAFAPGTRPPLAVAVGPSGSDLSRDLGRTWAPIEGPGGFHSVSFAKRGRAAWAVGRNGFVARLRLSLSADRQGRRAGL